MDRSVTAWPAFLLFVAVAAAVVAVVFFLAAVRVRRSTAAPDRTGEELVGGLTEEVRRWRAEAGHWRRTAERLQRELDQRGSGDGA